MWSEKWNGDEDFAEKHFSDTQNGHNIGRRATAEIPSRVTGKAGGK